MMGMGRGGRVCVGAYAYADGFGRVGWASLAALRLGKVMDAMLLWRYTAMEAGGEGRWQCSDGILACVKGALC